MIDRKTISLINGEVDGVNTPQESEILRQTLARNPEAQKLLDDLKKLERTFSAISPTEPPKDLKANIMRSLRDHRTPARVAARGFNLFDFVFPVRPLPRMGFAFSGGVLAGILLVVLYFTVASHPAIDARDASGTIFGSSSESMQTSEDVQVTTGGADGRIITEYSGSVSVMRVNLTLKPDLTARFVFDPDAARLRGISLADEFPGSLTNSEGMLEMGHGGGMFRAFFAPGASSPLKVRFQIVSAGNVLFERSLQLGKVQ